MGGLLTVLVLFMLAGCRTGSDNKDASATGHRNSEPLGHDHASAIDEYTCPMHPQIVQDKPGSCPICGMDLVKKAAVSGDSLVVDASLKALLQPTNSMVVAGIKTVRPERRSQPVTVQTNGIITYDTRQLYTIPARFSGRIEKMYIRFAYQPVRKGQKLLELYSPDIITAQRELIYLLESDPENSTLISGAKQKLWLLGITEGQLADLIRTRKPSYSLAVYSPYDGYVVETTTAPTTAPSPGAATASGGMGSGGMRSGTDEATFSSSPSAATPPDNASGALLLREGQYIQAGQTLFRIVNPNLLWAEFRLYARDADGVKPGDALTITFDQTGQPARSARVSFVIPFMEGPTRFVTVRAYLPSGQRERVGQLARAILRRPATDGLWLPATAVLDLGDQQVAFVQKEKGVFQPIRVQTGAHSGNWIAITGGLTEDQDVAQNGQFLIDSESFVNTLPSPQ